MSTNRFRRIAGSIGLTIACLVGLAGPAAAAGPSYVALGDSYASGVGTRSYIDDGSGCYRSTLAYPALISTARGYTLNFRACSGARTSDVAAQQLSALNTGTRYVSLSVGGNDAGFADVLTECAQPGWMSNCNGAIDTAVSFINYTLPGRLASLYSQIRSRAPQAIVVVVGYPRIFNGEDCNAFTWFSPTEESRLNATGDLLNSKIATAAGNAGFRFVNPTSAFIGHAVCDDVEWINGLSNPIVNSYHPNAAGHRYGFTPLVSPRLTGATVTVTPDVVAASNANAGFWARQQQAYAAGDRTITPETVQAPDLTTAAAKAAAAKAGVDLADRASIDRADRVFNAKADKAFAAQQRAGLRSADAVGSVG